MAKRIILLISLVLVSVVLLRGFLYRQMVSYESIGPRVSYSVVNKDLAEYIEANLENENYTDIDEVLKKSLDITTRKLNFTADRNDVDPNKLINSEDAHCVGYAAFYAATCNYILKKHKLDHVWSAVPQIGKIYFLGMNVHNWFSSSFFKDHDFVIIRNSETGEIKAVDPTLYEYFYIGMVTVR